jgi:hypothetical protein
MALAKNDIEKVLSYDPQTGKFRWKITRGRCCNGKIAGSVGGYGYISIGINGTKYGAHRLAWLLMTENWPTTDIDHINGILTDNRIKNLRLATRSQNLGNSSTHVDSTSGLKGAAWDRQTGRWRCTLMIQGVKYDFGRYDTAEQAHEVYCRESSRLHGEFARHK